MKPFYYRKLICEKDLSNAIKKLKGFTTVNSQTLRQCLPESISLWIDYDHYIQKSNVENEGVEDFGKEGSQ